MKARLLRRADIVHRARTDPGAVALTFDDGPGPWTPRIARALEAHGCRGTFFVLGPAVQERPSVVAALVAAGHEVGNHLWSHADASGQAVPEIRAEAERTGAAVQEAAGLVPSLVRPPYCAAPERVARALGRRSGAKVVLRSVDPADWRAVSADDVVRDVLTAAGPGDIVCLHDGVSPANRGAATREVTAEAVEQLVPALLSRGLRPVTVSELLR
jgi:peptidoglycan/xylan/chitin deacetylase (PgdA/CDA1 family)